MRRYLECDESSLLFGDGAKVLRRCAIAQVSARPPLAMLRRRFLQYDHIQQPHRWSGPATKSGNCDICYGIHIFCDPVARTCPPMPSMITVLFLMRSFRKFTFNWSLQPAFIPRIMMHPLPWYFQATYNIFSLEDIQIHQNRNKWIFKIMKHHIGACDRSAFWDNPLCAFLFHNSSVVYRCNEDKRITPSLPAV